MSGHVKAALVQAAPVPLAVGAGITQLIDHVADAADVGAQLVAFGESFLGGYPSWLDDAPAGAVWEHRGTQMLHAILLEQALRANDPRLEPLQALVDRAGIAVSVGAHERVRSSLFGSQFLFRPHQPPAVHRKLVPMHGERMMWASGDGSTLAAQDAGWGRVGQLICWEHWMPLARAAMHHAGESVHVAAWPTLPEAHLMASRHYAFEGRCYVLAAATLQHRDDLLAGLALVGDDRDARALIQGMPDAMLQRGGSAILGPDGGVIAEAGSDPDLLVADLDLGVIDRALAAFDADGHHARPDVFELRIDRRPRSGVVDAEDGMRAA